MDSATVDLTAAYRAAEGPPSKTQDAVLAAFPTASTDDYVKGLLAANARRAASQIGGGR